MSEKVLLVGLLSKLLPLAGSILAYLSIVTVHEFGHFIFCKIFNVRTPTFSIGVGPVLWKKTFWDTEFCLSLLPLGGFVEIGGLGEPGQGDQEFADDQGEQSFAVKPYWQKMLILSGGIMFNLLFAFLIYTSLFTFGMPKNKIEEIKITSVVPDGPAAQAGLKEGDIIIGMDGKDFNAKEGNHISSSDFSMKIKESNGVPLHFSIKRGEKTHDISITPASEDPNDRLAPAKIKAGLSTKLGYENTPGVTIINAIKKGWELIREQVAGSLESIKYLFKEKSLNGVAGPIFIASELFKTAEISFKLFLVLVSFINIGLATMNLLPLGALDGGQMLFATIEAITRRKLSDSFKIWVNIISLGLFGLLFAYLILRDTLSLFGK